MGMWLITNNCDVCIPDLATFQWWVKFSICLRCLCQCHWSTEGSGWVIGISEASQEGDSLLDSEVAAT